MFASTARRLSLIALLASQTARETPCKVPVSSPFEYAIPAGTVEGQPLPVLERRCIFAAAAFAALAAFVLVAIVEVCLRVDVDVAEGDMIM
jgi:hypothetical protein